MATERDQERYDLYVAKGVDRKLLGAWSVEVLATQVRALDEEWAVPMTDREDPYSIAESILRVAREA